MLEHQQTIEHLSHVLGFIQSKEYQKEMPEQVSGIVKKFKHPQSQIVQKYLHRLYYHFLDNR